MSFDSLSLDARLTANLTRLGYRQPRPIQARGIPPIVQGSDLIGLAHTGTGKTATYVTGIVQQLLGDRITERGAAGRRARLRAVIVSPTRELATQGADEASRIVRGLSLRVAGVYGKVGLRPQVENLERGVDLLFGTPGRLRELAEDANISYAFVRHIVLDEADRLLDMGFLPQVRWLIERMPNLQQRLLFSATMAPPVERLAREHLTDPVRLEVDREAETVEHVQQRLVRCGDKAKLEHVIDEVQQRIRPGKAGGLVIFCRTRRRVGWVGAALRRHSILASDVHGDRTPAQRRRALEQFEAGAIDVIVATDVAARGLHIERIRTVMNYDLPLDPREYVHRVGRAGHGGHAGSAVTFLSAPDTERWDRIVKTVAPKITETTDLRPVRRSEAGDDVPARGRSGGNRAGSGRTRASGRSASGGRRSDGGSRGGKGKSAAGRGSRDTRDKSSARGPKDARGKHAGAERGAKRQTESSSPAAADFFPPDETPAREPRRHKGDKPRAGRRRSSSPIKPGTKPGGGVRKAK